MTIGARIKQRRKALGLTQKALGKKVGCDHSSISQYENGKTRNMMMGRFLALAEHLDVSPSWLLEGTGPESRGVSAQAFEFAKVYDELIAKEQDELRSYAAFIVQRRPDGALNEVAALLKKLESLNAS